MRNEAPENRTGWPAISAYRLGGPWPRPGAVWAPLGYRRGGGGAVQADMTVLEQPNHD